MIRSLLATLLLVGPAGGCDERWTPPEVCQETIAASCARLYDCLTPGELRARGLPPTEAACRAELAAEARCPAWVWTDICESGRVRDPLLAECIGAISEARCSDLDRDGFGIEACSDDLVCVDDDDGSIVVIDAGDDTPRPPPPPP